MLFFRCVSFAAALLLDTRANLWFDSFFKTLVDHEVTVELKNDIQIRGTLKSVDQYLNIKLDDIQVVEELKYPHLVSAGAGMMLLFLESGCDKQLADHFLAVFGEECFHQRKCSQIRTSARGRRGHSSVRRWLVLLPDH
jgi:small nuclear ribonucleoprotein (snRNP)-like protein